MGPCQRQKKDKENFLNLERWNLEVGCFCRGAHLKRLGCGWWLSHFICEPVRCSKKLVMDVEVLLLWMKIPHFCLGCNGPKC